MREIKAIVRPEHLDDVIGALHEIPEVPGVIVSRVEGIGRRRPAEGEPAGEAQFAETAMMKIEIVVSESAADRIVGAIQKAGWTGRPGDGKIFVLRVEEAVRIRSGERGESGL